MHATLPPILLTATLATPLSGTQADEGCAGIVRAENCRHGLPAVRYQPLLARMLAHPKPNGPLSQPRGVSASPFSGLIFDVPPAHPVAWLLQPTQPSSAPNAAPVPNAPAHRLAHPIQPERPAAVKGRRVLGLPGALLIAARPERD
ncbi:MAG: hypothetical protein J7551_04055 [Chloroflexi bacterium]|nr:hypothetical protein [Chloroflexota bacterium]